MERPDLKQFGDLTREDFERHPVWIGCHTADYDEEWYDDTDEETFRPWTLALPADASSGMFLVRATFELRDGSKHTGFLTPAVDDGDLGTQQPYLWVGNECFAFWGGMLGVPADQRQLLYSALSRTPADIFPLRFSVDPALATGWTSGEIHGFYRFAPGDPNAHIEV